MTATHRAATPPHGSTIAITGSTGHLGGLVARYLDAAGIPQILLARDPDSPRVPQLGSVADMRRADYCDPASLTAALRGIHTLFMVSAPESDHRLALHKAVIDAAATVGVKHVVYTSFMGAAPDAVFTLARTHHFTEEHLRASGMSWTFLRDSFYLDFAEDLVGEDGIIRGPAGQGRCAFVARADVARAAAAVLANPAAHAGATYTLTGPEALSLSDVARTISTVRGREVVFHNETLEEAYASRASYGAADWQVEAWVSTYTSFTAGQVSTVTDDVERLTGRAPLSLEELLRGSKR